MAYSATLANMRGILSDAEHQRILQLFSRAGLSMDHHQFDEEILDKGTKAILRTRDGLLRAAVPSPLGKCVFLNDVSNEELNAALRAHKELMKSFPRGGEGIDAFVDASDTGYTVGGKPIENGQTATTNGHTPTMNGHTSNGVQSNGHDPVPKKVINGVTTAVKIAANEEEPQFPLENGVNGVANGINGHTNGVVNGHA